MPSSPIMTMVSHKLAFIEKRIFILWVTRL
jgi:hypothetical protein